MNFSEKSSPFVDLRRMLDPRSVAVIGASEQAGNLGGVCVRLMHKFGYDGDLWTVNPKYEAVFGAPCVAGVADLPAPADLAVIATGVEPAPDIVRQCAAAGIRHGIVWAGGYSETGAEGTARQQKLLEICRDNDFTLVGPNCLGIINARRSMVASFASFLVEGDRLLSGNIAMISQSGGLATMAQAMAHGRGMGFGLTISSGNEAMLSAADYIHAAALDDETKVIAAYIEGIRDGARFAAAVSAAKAAGKPVVVLKGGKTAASAQAAAAHTGALAGEQRVWEAMTRELGIVPVSSLEEMLDVALYLSRLDLPSLPKGKGMAIVSFGGGSGVLSADQCAAHGLDIPALGAETQHRLKELAPPIASIQNPIDLTPQTFNQEKWFNNFGEMLDVVAADPAVDIVFCQFGPMAQRGPETARIVADLRSRTDKTVCLAWPLAPFGAPEVLEREKVYVFQEYERAITTMAKLAEAADHGGPAPAPLPLLAAIDWETLVPEPEAGRVIGEDGCHRILAKAGMPTARGTLTRNFMEAVNAAGELGYPLAVKGISRQVTHRAAAGLLAVDIRDDAELKAAFDRLSGQAEASRIELDGVYLQEMVAGRIEILVSAFRDPVFGTMVSCGAGGNLTEVIDDVVVARAPLGEQAARALLSRLRVVQAAAKLDAGARIADLAAVVSHFSQIVTTVPWHRFVLEINPLKWSADAVKAVDGLLIVEEP